MSDSVKRAMTFAVFGIGVFGGLWSCGLSFRGLFGAGPNDTALGVLALTFAFATPLPASVFALWRREIAGWWLIFASVFLPSGLIGDYLHSTQFGPSQDNLAVVHILIRALPIAGVLLGMGLFWVLTERREWPRLLRPG